MADRHLHDASAHDQAATALGRVYAFILSSAWGRAREAAERGDQPEQPATSTTPVAAATTGTTPCLRTEEPMASEPAGKIGRAGNKRTSAPQQASSGRTVRTKRRRDGARIGGRTLASDVAAEPHDSRRSAEL